MADLTFNVVALDQASRAFIAMAAQAERLQRRLDALDGKRVTATAEIDTGGADAGLDDLALKLSAGLTAAAAAGGIGVAGALAVLPPLFAGIAAAALASNERVAASYEGLGKHVVAGLRADAATLEDTFVGVSVKLGQSFDRLRPGLQSVFSDVGPQVDMLTDGVTDLAENAMPGLVRAVDSADPVFAGLQSLLAATGTGLSEFLTELAAGANSSGQNLDTLGGVIARLLPFAGQLLTFLSDLGSGALPVFASGVGFVLDVVSGLLDVLEPVAPVLGTITGAVLLTAAAWKAFTIGAAAVAAFGLATQAAGLRFGVMVMHLTGSAVSGAAAATAFTNLARGLPLLAAAAVGIGLVLDAARADTDEWAQSVLNGATSLAQLRQQIDDHNQSVGWLVNFVDDWRGSEAEVNAEIERQIGLMGPLEAAQARVQLAQLRWNDAVTQYGPESAQARAAAAELAAATDREAAASRSAADAAKTHTDQLIDLQAQQLAAANADVAYRQALIDQRTAQRDLAAAIRDHGAASDEAQQAGLRLEQAGLRVVASAGALARETNTLQGETVAATRAAEAETQQILQLATSADGRGSPALAALAGKLTDAQLQANNAAVATSGFATEVRTLPDGRRVYIAVDPETGEVVDLHKRIDALPKTTGIRVTASGEITGIRTTGVRPALASGGILRFADAGIMPGYSPGRDDHWFVNPTTGAVLGLSGGEPVMRPEFGRATGHSWVHAANAAARSGGVAGVQRWLLEHPPGGGAAGQAFARGGIFDDAADVAPNVHALLLEEISRQLADTVQRLATTMLGDGGGPGGVSWMMAALRAVFPGLALISGFRPGAITATGNRSYHSMGRAVDVPPRMDVFNFIRGTYGGNTRELIFSPAGGSQIHNGRPHMYSGVTRADHWDHVHWAFQDGGIVRKPTFGLIGEAGPEAVVPLTRPRRAAQVLDQAGLAGPGITTQAMEAKLDELIGLLRDRPQVVVQSMSDDPVEAAHRAVLALRTS